MPKFRIICLANSIKWHGRCIAGLRMDGGGWIRPVSDDIRNKGALFPPQYMTEDGTEIRPLDIIETNFIKHNPKPYQPENWLIGKSAWKKIITPNEDEVLTILRTNIHHDPFLFGNNTDRILVSTFAESSAGLSLALVEPKNLSLEITTSYYGHRQIRAHFYLGRYYYNLAVTDPFWKEHLNALSQGSYPFFKLANIERDDKVLLTISLGEPLADGYCYKLVAGVIVLPRRWKNKL